MTETASPSIAQPGEAPAAGPRPARRAASWSLTVAAALLLACVALLGWCMLMPVRWDGIGLFGAVALFFPLHVLLVTLLALLLMLLARRSGARWAARLCGVAALLSAIMALTPTFFIWQRASQLAVPLSIGEYFANAVHVNSGSAQPDRSVTYGTASDGTRLELDVWRSGLPDSGPPRPAVVFVHGGAWTHGNRSMSPDWDRWLNGLGYEVFDVEYRMAPPARWQDEIGDVKSALGWVSVHADEYHVDRERISVMGNSAGANLVMLAAYSAGDSTLRPSTTAPVIAVRSVVNLYGPTDMARLYRNCKSPDFVHASMENYIGGPPEEFSERYHDVSPLSYVSAKSPPTLTILGTSDRLVATEQADELDRALVNAGATHELILLPGNDHGFDANWGGFGTQIARARIRDFLQRNG